MANPEHLAILKQGVEVWNKWREENPSIEPNLRKAELNKADLSHANLSHANLYKAKLYETLFYRANLTSTNLIHAKLVRANFCEADLTDAKLMYANLKAANLHLANCNKAVFTEAILDRAVLVDTKLNGADLSDCSIYGISAWNLKLDKTVQTNLRISAMNEPLITVDNLEVAQFVYLLLNNEKIRDVIDTITSKVVLILGRFTDERKVVLDALRDELRKRNYSPVLFDFDKPASRDLTETISTLAHMARFIIADITEPRCIPQELATIVPTLSVPVKPLLLKGATGEYAMFRDLSKYSWVMTIYRYKNSDELIQSLETKVIAPAEKKAKALIKNKNR